VERPGSGAGRLRLSDQTRLPAGGTLGAPHIPV